MAKIVIERISSSNLKEKKIAVTINDFEVVLIEDGETKVIDINKGKHSIYANFEFNFSPTQEVELNEEDIVKFQLKSKNPIESFVYGLIDNSKYFELKKISEN